MSHQILQWVFYALMAAVPVLIIIGISGACYRMWVLSRHGELEKAAERSGKNETPKPLLYAFALVVIAQFLSLYLRG